MRLWLTFLLANSLAFAKIYESMECGFQFEHPQDTKVSYSPLGSTCGGHFVIADVNGKTAFIIRSLWVKPKHQTIEEFAGEKATSMLVDGHTCSISTADDTLKTETFRVAGQPACKTTIDYVFNGSDCGDRAKSQVEMWLEPPTGKVPEGRVFTFEQIRNEPLARKILMSFRFKELKPLSKKERERQAREDAELVSAAHVKRNTRTFGKYTVLDGYLYDPNQKKIATLDGLYEAHYHPFEVHGREAFWIVRKGGESIEELWVLDLKTKRKTLLSSLRQMDFRVSPDGNSIAYPRERTFAIFDRNKKEERVIASAEGEGGWEIGGWSPDGKELYFSEGGEEPDRNCVYSNGKTTCKKP